MAIGVRKVWSKGSARRFAGPDMDSREMDDRALIFEYVLALSFKSTGHRRIERLAGETAKTDRNEAFRAGFALKTVEFSMERYYAVQDST